MSGLTEFDWSAVAKEDKIIPLPPLSLFIKSNILEVEHLSSFKCQGTKTYQTSPFEGL